MKQLFVSILVVAAGTASAQKFQLGFNGGLGMNTNPSIVTEMKNPWFVPERKASGLSLLGSVSLMRDGKSMQYGIEAGCRQLSYRYDNNFIVLQGTQSIADLDWSKNYNSNYISKWAYTIKAFANHKLVTGRFTSYAGLSAGYVLATKCEDPYALADIYYDKVNGNGLSLGLQLGTTYFITKRFGVNGQIGGDYMMLTVGSATYSLVSFPATIGLRFRL